MMMFNFILQLLIITRYQDCLIVLSVCRLFPRDDEKRFCCESCVVSSQASVTSSMVLPKMQCLLRWLGVTTTKFDSLFTDQ